MDFSPYDKSRGYKQDEVSGLMTDLLVSQKLPKGHTRFSYWLDEHVDGARSRVDEALLVKEKRP